MLKRFCLFFGLLALFQTYGATQVSIGKRSAKAGDWVEIPIQLQTNDNIIALQFDVFVPLAEIEIIDTRRCFSEIFAQHTLSGCRQQRAPNADVIRYYVIADDFKPLPSGELTRLKLRIKKSAYSGQYPITIANKTLLGFDNDGHEYVLNNYPGALIIDGQPASRRPAAKPSTLFANNDFNLVSRRPTSISSHTITENWETVANNPSVLHVQLPDGEKLVFHRVTFAPKKGFVNRIGSDEKLPDPAIKPEARQYFWYGKAQSAEMGITVHNGVGGGFITTADASYSINGVFAKTRVEKIDRNRQSAQLCLSSPQSNDSATHLNHTKAQQSTSTQAAITARSGGHHTIRVLVMYTQQARTDAGGQAGIDQLIQQSMNQLNQAVVNSGINNVYFQLAKSELLPGFYANVAGVSDRIGYRKVLSDLRVNPVINSLRNTIKADVVITMIRNGQTGSSQLPACGLSFVQVENCTERYPDTPEYCARGAGYNDFAYAAASVDCAIIDDRHSFAHEVGHMMGLQHQRGPYTSYPENRLIARFAYAHSGGSGANQFNTVMWSSVGEPHYLNFSNPNVTINGIASGITNYNDNARALLISATTVEQYREAFNARIYEDSFE